MKTEIIAPYSKLFGQEGEIKKIQVASSILHHHIAIVNINGMDLTFNTDEIKLSEETKDQLLQEWRRRFLA